MIASCATDVKFHNWESCDHLGSVKAPDPKARSFLDISWCNEGRKLVAVPISGKSLLLTVNPPVLNALGLKEEPWKPNKEIIEIAGVRCASFSKAENANVVLGTMTGEVMLYDVFRKNVLQTFVDLPGAVNIVQYGANDLFVAAACSNGQIFIYGNGRCISASYYVPCSEIVTSIAVHSRVPYLLGGGSEKGVVAIWDINTGNNILKSTNHTGSVLDMSFSATDESFTTIGNDQKINIYDLRTSECVHDKQFDTDLTALAYCPNGNDIAVSTGRGHIICLDKRYLHACKVGLKAHKCAIRKISFETSNLSPKLSTTTYSKIGDMLDDDDQLVEPDVKITNELDKYSLQTSRCPLRMNNGRTTFHIIDENSLNQLRDDITKATKEIVNSLVESMNREFLKMRMGVSREFCSMEIRNKKRWQEFNMVLLKIADLEDQENVESLSNIKEPTMISQVKTRMSSTNFLHRTSSKSVK